MTRGAVFALVAALVACDRAQGVPDEELGALVIAPKEAANATIDVLTASKDPVLLGHALARPWRASIAGLGPHTITIAMTTTLDAAGNPAEALVEKTVLELGDKASFHGLYENSADYGREVTYLGDKLYLRPRYQRWHERAPETIDEAAQLRDQFVDAIGATWELFAPGAAITDKGNTTVAGRPARAIAITRAAQAAPNPTEKVTQRKWREGRTVEAIEGTIALDDKTGAPLSVVLDGSVAFPRDGKRMVMKVHLEATVDKIGSPAAIVLPPAAEVVATPERQREVDDHDFLLDGIAPPIRKNDDGSTVPPQPKFAGSGSAGDVKLPLPGATPAPPVEEDKPKKRRKKTDEDGEKSERSESSESKSGRKSDSTSENSEPKKTEKVAPKSETAETAEKSEKSEKSEPAPSP